MGIFINVDKKRDVSDVFFPLVGKNLFDKNTAVFKNISVNSNTGTFVRIDKPNGTFYMEIEPSTKYTVTKSISNSFRISVTSEIPDIGVKVIDTISDSTGTNKLSISTTSKGRYLCIYPLGTSEKDLDMNAIVDTIQVEKGSVATEYEPYTVTSKRIKSIWVNKGGVPTKVHTADNKGLLVGYGSRGICLSKNARSWALLENFDFAEMDSLTYGEGFFIGASNSGKSYYSQDGEFWVEVLGGLPTYTTSGTTRRIFYHRNLTYGKGLFVCLSRQQTGTTTSNGVTKPTYLYKFSYSLDGASWTSPDSSFSGSGLYINTLAYGGGKFIALGNAGEIFSSTDGKSWSRSSTTTLPTGQFHGLAYGNGKFVCVGELGKSYYSTDGKSWNSTSGLDKSVKYHGVTYGNGRFVCVGEGGKSYYSTDGVTWKLMNGLDSEYTYYAVTYGYGRFVCVGAGKSYYSKDGGSWTPMSGDTEGSLDLVAFNFDGGYDNSQ